MSYQATHFVKVLTEERLKVPVDHLGGSQLVLRFSPAGEICDYQSTNTKIRLGSEKNMQIHTSKLNVNPNQNKIVRFFH